MAIGIGAIIGGIGALAGAFKKSSTPSAPAYPELSPEMKMLQDEMTKYAQYDMRSAFSDLTGGLDIQEYTQIQDVMDMTREYDYLRDRVKGELLRKYAGDERLTDYLGGKTIVELNQRTSANGQTGEQFARAVEGESFTFDGKAYKVKDFFPVSANENESRVRGWQLELDNARYEAYSKVQANIDTLAQRASAGSLAPLQKEYDATVAAKGGSSWISTPEGRTYLTDLQGRATQIVNAEKARITKEALSNPAQYLKGEDARQYTLRSGEAQKQLTEAQRRGEVKNSGFDSYIADYAANQGLNAETLKRRMEDMGLYEPEKNQFYRTFDEAVVANDGKLPSESVNGILAYRLELERTGNIEDAQKLDTYIKDRHTEYYNKYFDPEEGLWTQKNPLEKYADPNIAKPDYIKGIEAAIGGNIDKLFTTPATKDSSFIKTAEAQFGKAGALLDQALTAGAATDQAAQAWMQERLSKGVLTPAEFEEASALLKTVPGVLEQINQIRTEGTAKLDSLNSFIAGALGQDWKVTLPQDARREGVLNTLASGFDQAASSASGTDPYREKALSELLNRATSTTNPYEGMSADEIKAKREASVSAMRDELLRGQLSQEEVLAKRNAADSTQGNVERANLLNEVVGKRSAELEANLSAEQLARSAEATARNEQERVSILNNLANAGQENRQFNLQNRQALADQILAATGDDVRTALQTGQINLEALQSKLNAANQTAAQQAQTLATTLGITAEQANTILKAASATADVGSAVSNADVQGTTSLTNVANTATDAANQARETGVKAAGTAADIGSAAAGTAENVARADAGNASAQAGLLNAITSLSANEYERDQFNQVQPIETTIAKQNAMTGALQDTSGILNNYLNTLNNRYQGDINTWQGNVAKANSKADAFGTLGSVLSGWFK
jgi:hypothetical protein